MENGDGQAADITFTQKDIEFIYMAVEGKTYKMDLDGLMLNIWALELRRRQSKEDAEKNKLAR